VHGDRRPSELAPDAVAETRRRFARPEAVEAMLADWRASVDAVQALPEVGVAPLGYWGLSMGTLFGVPLLAAEPRIVVGVLGLMGIRPDGGRIALRLAEDAPRVRCPVLFLQQRQDELFPVETSGQLFDALASADKRLHAHSGAHAAVPPEEFRASEEFLARHLVARA
jgi:dienelactone hydrolase